ncbi:LysR substrate-binding domain-containing protein [Pararhizobium sp. YC-54]|uniref:LysR substrate-binding domain-containing protein n=1 Tax=Pararhizobium sp. YC-54 TaxID=2986920 RepID=UPI0021F71D4A|nr:LysR substrate-binding domain-containing protein [Pararhizobium sp. YC-54]MCW0002145.1 LysR substrate-binding domain-containing protein [Pararhizobium sp. YC-54]
MSHNLPPLIALRAFEAVARTGSVRAAGDELSVSHTAISRHIQNLQNRLGVAFFEREGRGLTLTGEGKRYYLKISRAFEAITVATSELKPNLPSQLDIWCTPGIASIVLLPRLPDLEKYLPKCDVALRPTRRRPDLEAQEADAEIVFLFDGEERQGCHVEVLNRPRMFPVASPTFLDRHGPVSSVDELLNLPLIHEESTDQWERWFSHLGRTEPISLHGPKLWNGQQTIESARLGQGVTITGSLLVEPHIARGELVEVLSTNIYLGSYCLVTTKSRSVTAPILALRRWLADVLA